MRTWIITPLFCKPLMLMDYLEHMSMFHPYICPDEFRHVLVDDRYPIDENHVAYQNKHLAQMYGVEYFDAGRNLGMQGAINAFLKTREPLIGYDDIIILSDVDDRASPGSYRALRDFLWDDPADTAVVALSSNLIEYKRQTGHPVVAIQKYKRFEYWTHPSVDQWHIAAYRASWIREIGGFNQTNQFWGGLEAWMYSKYKPQRKNLVYLQNYICDHVKVYDTPNFVDESYKEYKKEICRKNGEGSYGEKESFEAWLNRQP